MASNFKINKEKLSHDEIIKDATADELRVLLSVVALGGDADEEFLTTLSGVKVARIKSALLLWQEYGVLEKRDSAPTITEEFEERISRGEILEESACEVALGIRDNNLRGVIEEFSKLMNKSHPSPLEVKRITALSTQYGLSAEYIALYMAHLAERGALTSAAKLASGAIRMAEEGITTTEALEVYLRDAETKKNKYNEIKKLLGIYGRSISKSESSYFDKWTCEFGYDIIIIGEAYDITALNTGKASLQYMDKLLSDWYSVGAMTLEACRERYDSVRESMTAATAPKKKQGVKEKPRYGTFDPDEALRAALRRTYGEDSSDGGEGNQ